MGAEELEPGCCLLAWVAFLSHHVLLEALQVLEVLQLLVQAPSVLLEQLGPSQLPLPGACKQGVGSFSEETLQGLGGKGMVLLCYDQQTLDSC